MASSFPPSAPKQHKTSKEKKTTKTTTTTTTFAPQKNQQDKFPAPTTKAKSNPREQNSTTVITDCSSSEESQKPRISCRQTESGKLSTLTLNHPTLMFSSVNPKPG
jgi:hypothetical protein